MPIVTPCYPSMNSSFNVSQPQLRRLKQEFVLADQLIADIEKGEREWDELFVGKEFFRQHIHFVKVDIIATSEDSFRAWFGLCESRLRILVAAMESDDLGTQCYPFAKCFRRVEENDDGEETHIASFFVALRFAEGVEDVDLKPNAEEFLYKINSWEGRQQGMDLMIDCLVQNELPSYVFDDGDVGNTMVCSLERRTPCLLVIWTTKKSTKSDRTTIHTVRVRRSTGPVRQTRDELV